MIPICRRINKRCYKGEESGDQQNSRGPKCWAPEQEREEKAEAETVSPLCILEKELHVILSAKRCHWMAYTGQGGW